MRSLLRWYVKVLTFIPIAQDVWLLVAGQHVKFKACVYLSQYVKAMSDVIGDVYDKAGKSLLESIFDFFTCDQ